MFFRGLSAQELLNAIKALNLEADEALCFLIGEEAALDCESLIAGLNELGVTFWGAIFPGVIYGQCSYKDGIVLLKLPIKEKPLVIEGLDNKEIKMPPLHSRAEKINSNHCLTVFVDGLTANIAGFLSSLFDELGCAVCYLGGGAGSMTLKKQPCLFTNDGIFQDAAVITFLKQHCIIGVRHGWKKIKGPVIATKTKRNRIIELNWKSAFAVYREIVEQDSGLKFGEDNFFEIARGYPFGILKESGEHIIRDPFYVSNNGSLVCVGEVPENTVLNIMRGHSPDLIAAAGKAVRDSCPQEKTAITAVLVFDCISRTLFLADHFSWELAVMSEEIQAINESLVPVGALSIGEIASYGREYLEFLNKTVVVGMLHGG